MALKLDLKNIFQLISTLSPLLVTFSMLMISLFNVNIKGLVYLAGILLANLTNIVIGSTIGHRNNDNASILCNLINMPYVSNFNIPSSTTVFLSFTLVYLTLPMLTSSQFNPAMISFFLALIVVDAISKISNKCTTHLGILLGLLFGSFFGATWYSLIKNSGYESLLYYEELQSNKVRCSKPTKQTFKCSVYKNGKLISNGSA